MRKIVVLKPHEWLGDSFRQQNFSIAAGNLEKHLQTEGMEFLKESPVQVPIASEMVPVPDPRGAYLFQAHNYAVGVEFEDEKAEARFTRDRSNEIEGVYSDPAIEPFPVACPSAAVGSVADVIKQIRILPVHAAGYRGAGVRIAVVD